MHPLRYNAGRLNVWAGTHCGDWSTLTALQPFGQDEVVPDNAEWDIAPQPQQQTSTQDVTYVNRGPPPGAFNRVDGTVSIILLHYECTQMNGNDLFLNRVILEDMIQRTQLTTRAIGAPMWAMLSHHRLVLQAAL